MEVPAAIGHVELQTVEGCEKTQTLGRPRPHKRRARGQREKWSGAAASPQHELWVLADVIEAVRVLETTF